MAVRALRNIQVVKPLSEIGWRSSRQYFALKDSNDPKTEKVLTWTHAGPDFCLNFKSLRGLQKSLAQLQVIIFNCIGPLQFNMKMNLSMQTFLFRNCSFCKLMAAL